MPETLINVVYSGEIIAPDRPRVIAAFAKMFKLDPARAENILASRHRVLKSGISPEQGERFKKALSSIGVLVYLEPHSNDPEQLITLEPESESAGTEPELTEASPAPGQVEQDVPGRGGLTSVSDIDPSQLSVEPPSSPPPPPSIFAAIQDGTDARRLGFRFSGSGTEYFRIWIVNIALSIVTLGIYSAWAKVRTNRYFYSNTWLDNACFEYLADPWVILRGRVLVVVLFVIYQLLTQFDPTLGLAMLAIFLFILPWLIASGLRFRMRCTGYRNIRFGFEGSVWGAVKAYTLMFLLVPLTLGLLFPYMLFLQTQYLVDNTRYGVDHFSFNVSPRQYYQIYLQASLLLLAVIAIAILGVAMNPVLGGLLALAGYALLLTFVKVKVLNLMFDDSHLGDHRFSSALELLPLFKIYMVNAVLMLLTLGLFYPWAKVRIARYRADRLMMIACGRLDYYVASQEQEFSAIGEETADLFDFDIGF